MELRHLRYFLAVAEAQNFTKASHRLRIAQPALGRQVQDLEADLGVTLLERSPRGASLTAAGAAFADEAKAVLQRVEDAVRVARAFARGERGELHLGYAPSPTVELLPPILHAFQNEAPEVRIVLHDFSTEEMLQGLRSGKLQLALIVRPRAKELSRLRFEELCRYPLCAAVPNRHPLAGLKTVGLHQFAGTRLVVYSRAEYPEYHEQLAEVFAAAGTRLPLVEEHDSATSLIAAVEAGRGIALVPASFSCLAGPRLRIIELRPAPTPVVVGVAYDPRRLSPASERFIKLARTLPKSRRAR